MTAMLVDLQNTNYLKMNYTNFDSLLISRGLFCVRYSDCVLKNVVWSILNSKCII